MPDPEKIIAVCSHINGSYQKESICVIFHIDYHLLNHHSRKLVESVKLLLCYATLLTPISSYHEHVHINLQILLTHLIMTYLLKHLPYLILIDVSVTTPIILLKYLIKLLSQFPFLHGLVILGTDWNVLVPDILFKMPVFLPLLLSLMILFLVIAMALCFLLRAAAPHMISKNYMI